MNALEKLLNQFAHSVDEELTVTLGEEFAYYYTDSKVEVCLEMDWRNDDFTENLKEQFSPKVDLHPFWWSILHEIGHHETASNCVEDDLLIRAVAMMSDDYEVARKLYYGMESESLATEWAVEYAEEHFLELQEWQEKLLILLNRG